jgi:spoIIIJ-associated protein
VSESTTSEADRPSSDLPSSDLPSSDLPSSDLPGSDLPKDGLEAAQQDSAAEAPQTGGAGVPASPSATAVEEPPEPTDAPVGTSEDAGSSGVHTGADSAGPEDSASIVEETPDIEETPDAAEAPDAADARESADGESADGEGGDVDRLENEGDIAADYLEELLDIADLDGDLDMDVEGDRAAVSIVGGDVRLLVGRDGEVLEALQELTRLAVYRETGERSRLMLDVGGFRADKRSRLERVAADAVAEVQASGERKALDPMTPFERKVVHDVVAASGLSSASEGQEPRRYVVVLPS